MNKKDKREWIIRYAKKNDISDILNKKYQNKKSIKINTSYIEMICSIISVLIIGFLSVFISYQQIDLADKNNQLYEKEISPHFRTNELIIKNYDEYHWENVIQIKNHGGNYYMFHSDVFSFIFFYQKGNTYVIPLYDYYVFSVENNSDNIVIEHFTDMREKIKDLINKVNNSLPDVYNDGYYDKVVSYVRINYQNSFGDEKIQYFEANKSRLLDNDTGDRYYDLCTSLKYLNDKGYRYNALEMNLEQLLEFANTDLKDKYIFK